MIELKEERDKIKVSSALDKLDDWIKKEKYLGWDPFDALNSPILNKLSLNNRMAGIVWVQLIKQLPINLRKPLGIKKEYNPKGIGLFLSSYLRKYEFSNNNSYKDEVDFLSYWLEENIIPGYHGACWGYNFDWPNRGFYAKKGTPNIINTAFIGLAFLELYRLFGDDKALSIARSACDFILKDLNVYQVDDKELCFSYTPLDRRFIHNANLMGALLLAEVFTQTEELILAEKALASVQFSIKRQRNDGSWFYGEAKKEQWIDNFHTGFVLVSLKRISDKLNQDSILLNLKKGYSYWKNNFFLDDGTPKYYPNSTYPIDIHCVAQSILTFLEFTDIDPYAELYAWRLALWGVSNMQDEEGFVYYQIK